jgi:transglutaminase-like putative cysteine protease
MSAAVPARKAPERAPNVARAAEGEPWLATALRMLVHALAALVFAFPLTVVEAMISAAVGAALGAFGARFVAASRIRSTALVLLSLALLFAVSLAGALPVGTDLLAPSLGPSAALRVGEAITFGLGALVVSTALRSLSIRRPALTALEVAFVAVAFASLVVAHRNGAINRPFEIADPIIAQGGDPTVAMMAIGAAAAAAIVVLLMSERNALRGVFHLSAIVVLLLFAFGVIGLLPEPSVPATGGGLGLRADGEDESSEEQESRGSGRRSNEELEFRDNYDNAQNRIPVGVVLLHDDYSPPSGVYYFRQGAFSQYNGRRLVAATRADVDHDIARAYPTRRTRIEDPPEAGMWRSTLETTVAMLAEHNRPFALESPIDLRPEPNPDPRRFKRMYRATSAALTADHVSLIGVPVGSPTWSDEVQRHYTEAPDDARYQELATRIVTELPSDLAHDPVARALAVTGWLSREGTYSLRSRHAGAEDPTASFLFGDVTGYCVHFAHAAVYLMRTLGVPARVATGYAVEESTRQGGSAVLVTGGDSHAWPEIYVEGVGWVVVDVAPQTVVTPPPGPPDADLQRLLAELARGRRPLPVDGRTPPAIGRALGDALAFAGWALLYLAVAALGLVVIGRFVRRASPLFAREDDLYRVLYRVTIDQLSALGVRRSYGESREAFARRIAGIAPSFVPLTRGHVGAKFGGSTKGDPRALRGAVVAELRRAFPLWRRFLGAVTPWSWLVSR